MDNIYVYFLNLPPGINEMVTPCLEGYTVYIDARLDEAHRLEAYNHALAHIHNDDYSKADVQQIESDAHRASV